MGKRGPKPDPVKQSQVQTKVYLSPENLAHVANQKNKTEYFNKLIEKDRLEGARKESERSTILS